MYIDNLNNLELYSTLSLKLVEDRMLINADFRKDFVKENKLIQPFFYVTIYARGGKRIKLIDEGTAKIYNLSKSNFSQATYQQLIKFAMKYSKQFKHIVD
ncbi:hypothetical protein BN1058_00749 [Paraliobacillus sp. PM-2]|uniref:hypothetical protein n=1 Tax=Paraliobacillus sp. PM-2 TaxID=1462524 RepID=UPI00061CC270|nr:hypothetical protein [Paraliobacillus sp. PM-2]CQR46488.1 hypothetical protein BN1058_00749 [Paraliobacillus sp. PM-2]